MEAVNVSWLSIGEDENSNGMEPAPSQDRRHPQSSWEAAKVPRQRQCYSTGIQYGILTGRGLTRHEEHTNIHASRPARESTVAKNMGILPMPDATTNRPPSVQAIR